jgi:hypothetical protein
LIFLTKNIIDFPDYDFVITYSWNCNDPISGHTFEAIEYFFIISSKFKVAIFFGADISWSDIETVIIDKYDFSSSEINFIKNNSFFFFHPLLLKANNILVVDGAISSISPHLCASNVFFFACGDLSVKHNIKSNYFILQDNRIYDDVSVNGIHYIKKILFSRFKKIINYSNNILIYSTFACRDISLDYIDSLNTKFPDSNFLLLTNSNNIKINLPSNFTSGVVPFKNLFSSFSSFLYSPLPFKFDCSPRFIAECNFYSKNVFFDIDYSDKGLFFRRYDIDNNFNSLFLDYSDPIFHIINKAINEC